MGPDGYQVDGFPAGWMEWNGRYRDAVRDYWRDADSSLPGFAAALCGSADMLAPRRRPAWTSVNVVTVHDGFTPHDLVSYNEKHNEANGEDNKDGESHNRSWNCGAEGASDDAEVLALRQLQVRNFLTTLFLSLGTPLLLGGDEVARNQSGNNNAYCQDSPLAWHDWQAAGAWQHQLEFTRSLIQLRQSLPVLRPAGWMPGLEGGGYPGVSWHSVWGLTMTQEEWEDGAVRCVSALLHGQGTSVLMLFNPSAQEATFTLPQEETARRWVVRADANDAMVRLENGSEGSTEDGTASGTESDTQAQPASRGCLPLAPHSIMVLTAQAAVRSGS
jgi:isoamylase